MRRLSSLFMLPCLCAALVAASPQKPAPTLGFDPANLDTSVKPGDHFYQYAVGGWLKRTPFPADKSRFGSFEEVESRNSDILKGIFEELSAQKTIQKGSIQQQVADFYRSGMNEAQLEKLGLKPLQKDLKRLDAIKDLPTLAKVLGQLNDLGLGGPFSFYVGQDAKESTQYLAYLSQSGLGLPDKDYYLKDDARSKEIRSHYLAHVEKVLGMTGDKEARVHAQAIMDLETELARLSWSRTELRDPIKRYNKKNMEELSKLVPNFEWKIYFTERKLDIQELSVGQPSFFEGLNGLLVKTPIQTWKTYLSWHLLRNRSSMLSKAFFDADFEFYGKFMNGQPEPEPRWKRVKETVDRGVGHSLGQLYVEKAFAGDAKAKIKALVENVRAAFKTRIEAAEWMQPETKQKAIQKLQAFGVKVGYPDVWKTYNFEVKTGDYYGNIVRSTKWHIEENKAKLGKPINRTEWGMTPPTVNAYYSPSMNEIVFPAGILQPPFFDPKADDAVNYGGIGWVIAHEMTHGFDDSGSNYDFKGNLNAWWTDQDRKAYASRTDLIVKQFDAYEALKGQFINGKMTLGENISDLGGMKVAFAAYQMSLNGQQSPVIERFTGEQRFFIGGAQVWRNHIRDQALSVRLKTDVHSPGLHRVIGPMSNLPEFHKAFGIKEGEAMFRPESERPVIW